MAGASKEDDERDDWFEVMGLSWDATADDVKDGVLSRCVALVESIAAWCDAADDDDRMRPTSCSH